MSVYDQNDSNLPNNPAGLHGVEGHYRPGMLVRKRKVSKSGVSSGKEQSQRELKTARTLNTLATIGAGHAILASTPAAWRSKVPGRKKLVSSGWLNEPVSHVKKPLPPKVAQLMPKAGKPAKIAGAVAAGGWLTLHGAELAGDVMARRSINGQLARTNSSKGKVGSMAKNDMTLISKASGSVSGNGHGKSLSSGRTNRQRAGTTAGLGAVLVGQTAATGGHLAMNNVLRDTAFVMHGQSSKTNTDVAGDISRLHRKYKQLKRFRGAGLAGIAGGGALIYANRNKKVSGVEKAYRRVDPEADRQRRIGMYSGLAGGGSLVAANRAANHIKITKPAGTSSINVRGNKKGALLATGAAALAGASVATYRHGISARNQPWT